MIRMYDNAAANLDDQLQLLHEQWQDSRARRGTPVTVIIGDHGESFFEDESFGHGLELTEAQTATPIVLHGGWGEVPSPTGQSDLRPLLLKMLSDSVPTPNEYTPIPRERPIFQMIGRLDQPLQIAWVDRDGRRMVDFTRGVYIDSQGRQTLIADLPQGSDGLGLLYEWESRVLDVKSPSN